LYEPYPSAGLPRDTPRAGPPRTVVSAVRLMYAGAALEVLALIVALVTRASLKSAILTRHPGYTPAQLHTAELARTVPLIIGALVAVGLWLWMAWANGKGRNWGRVVSAVFFGINTLDLLLSLGLVHAAATEIVGLIIWLAGLAVIILIFSKKSAPFYTRQPQE